MPFAVTHILVPIFLISLFRDYIKKTKNKKFHLHYVLIAGLAGVLPDLDIAFYALVYKFGFEFDNVHRGITHTIFFPLIFIILAMLIYNKGITLTKSKLRLDYVFLFIAFGIFTHLALDAIFSGQINPLAPIVNYPLGLDLVNYLPSPLDFLGPALLDGFLFIIWLAYLECKHKLSSFI